MALRYQLPLPFGLSSLVSTSLHLCFIEVYIEFWESRCRGLGLFLGSHFIVSATVVEVEEALGITGLSTEPHYVAEETQN